jgi:hypothetical protein
MSENPRDAFIVWDGYYRIVREDLHGPTGMLSDHPNARLLYLDLTVKARRTRVKFDAPGLFDEKTTDLAEWIGGGIGLADVISIVDELARRGLVKLECRNYQRVRGWVVNFLKIQDTRNCRHVKRRSRTPPDFQDSGETEEPGQGSIHQDTDSTEATKEDPTEDLSSKRVSHFEEDPSVSSVVPSVASSVSSFGHARPGGSSVSHTGPSTRDPDRLDRAVEVARRKMAGGWRPGTRGS